MLSDSGHAQLSLVIDLSGYEDDWRHVSAFRGQSGWLLMARATIQSEHDLLTDTLIVACDDRDIPIPAWRARHLCQCPWSGLDACYEEAPDILDELLCEEEGAFYARWQRDANADLALLHERTELAVAARERRAKSETREIERHIRDLRRQRRFTVDEEILRALSAAIVALETESDAALEKLLNERAALRRSADAAEEALWLSDDVLIEVEPLRLIRWRDGTISPETRPVRVWRSGEFYAPTVLHDRRKPEDAGIVLAKFSAALRANAERGAEERPVTNIEPRFEIADLPKASPFLRKLATAAVAPTPTPVVSVPMPSPFPVTTTETSGASYGKLDIERDVLIGLLDGLEGKALKFFPGSRKYLQNQEAQADMVRRIAALDVMIAGNHAAMPAASSDDQASAWSYKRVEMLKQLWVNGVSAGEIAKQIGDVSRNAVIGKAKRLGLPFNSTSEGETFS